MSVVILGVDAAWTPRAPAGVATLALDGGRRRFLSARADTNGFEPELALNPQVIAIDMPIARTPVRARRHADNAVARRFGRYKASVHSPTPERPGPYGDAIVAQLVRRGYHVATADGERPQRALLEVFPLAALVRFLRVDERPRYKAAKSAQYWPHDPPPIRRTKLLEEWRRIDAYLRTQIEGVPTLIPHDFLRLPAARLKRYEDTIDALICALLGALYVENALEPFGDTDAAIWLPAIFDPESSPTTRS